MISLSFAPGEFVKYENQHYKVISAPNFKEILGRNVLTGKSERIPISELKPIEEPTSAPLPLAAIDEKKWKIACDRYAIIKPLLQMENRTRDDVAAVAKAAGASTNTVYVWLRTYIAAGTTSALVPAARGQAPGKRRLDPDVEAVISDAIEEFYLHKQQHSIRKTYEEVCRRLRAIPLEPPHKNTIYNRINNLNHKTRLRRRSRKEESRATLTPHPGSFQAQFPLQTIQIDHHKLDIIVVDQEHRRPIGRPWITLGIDVYSRMVTGYYLSLDPPGTISTGLCVAHMILPKENFLFGLDVEANWPCWGVPGTIHLDNAKEFRGKMLADACLNYGITIEHRPVLTPNFGPQVERFFRTLSEELKGVRGTTFSNPTERAEYDSDAEAVMTLLELEKWVAIFITGKYHQQMHSSLDMSPLQKWEEAFFGSASRPAIPLPNKIIDSDTFQIEFLPSTQRTIQHYGVQFENVQYWHDVLRPYVEDPGKVRKQCEFRYDPRNMSRLYFLDPITKEYVAVPYRHIDRPPISLWELRSIRRQLRDEHNQKIDEEAIFAHQETLRKIENEAAKTTRQRRLEIERRKRHGELPTRLVGQSPSPSFGMSDTQEDTVEAFDDLELQ